MIFVGVGGVDYEIVMRLFVSLLWIVMKVVFLIYNVCGNDSIKVEIFEVEFLGVFFVL